MDSPAAPGLWVALRGSASPCWFEVFCRTNRFLVGRAAPPTGNRGHCLSRNPSTPSPLLALTKFPFVRCLPPASVPGSETHVDAVGSWHARRPRGARGASLSWRASLKTHTGRAALRRRRERGTPGRHPPPGRTPQAAASPGSSGAGGVPGPVHRACPSSRPLGPRGRRECALGEARLQRWKQTQGDGEGPRLRLVVLAMSVW